MKKPEFVEKSEYVYLELTDGRMIKGLDGQKLGDYLDLVEKEDPSPIMGGILNNELKELSHTVTWNGRTAPLRLCDADGWIIYRRSLIFLLTACFEELFPELTLEICHALLSGGILCTVSGEVPFTAEKAEQLETLMREKVLQDLPIIRREIPLEEARKLFTEAGKSEKLELLNYRQKDYMTVYRLGNYEDYHYGYMLPTTGKLKNFDLEYDEEENALLLFFPKNGCTEEIAPIVPTPQLMEIFRQSFDLKKRLGVNYLASINRIIDEGKAQRLVLVSESIQDRHIMQVAQKIADRKDEVRVVLIAGPSSSGKTTFSKRLSIELLVHGIIPIPVEMDNYFVNRDDTPLDENGNYDFECLGAMDVPQLAHDVDCMIRGETVRLPHYNFKTGLREPGETLRLAPDEVLILEGIHGLNPALLANIPQKNIFRIFIAPMTQINLDRYSRVSTVDVRLLRRIVRDYRDRGYSAQQTLARWGSVRAGEEKYIIPFQDRADAYMDSSLPYEVSALKPLAEAALRMVPYDSKEYTDAKRLLAFLEWARPLDLNMIPANSVLAEFIGGSNLKDYTVWN